MARFLIREAHGGGTRIIRDGALPFFLNQGWVVLETLDDDTDASPLYLSAAEGDLRWAKISDLGDPESAEVAVISEAVADSEALRAAFDARLDGRLVVSEDPNEPLTDGQILFVVEPHVFSPDELSPSMWYDAQQLTGADASAVTSWPDLSGNGRTLTPVTGNPTVDADGINGHKAAAFGGATYLDSTTAAVTPGGNSTVFLVATVAPDSGSGCTVFDGPGPDLTHRHWFQTNNTGTWQVSRDSSNIISAATRDALPHVFRVVFADNLSAHIDGTQVLSGASASKNTDLTKLRLGGRLDATAPLVGAVGEVLVFHRTLTASEITQVEDYLTAKWLA